jgi:hypothetical protein
MTSFTSIPLRFLTSFLSIYVQYKASSKHTLIMCTCSLLSTDIHHIETPTHSNRSTTSTTFSDCSATKQGNMIHIGRLILQLYTHYFTQTLTTLDLSSNQIGAVGAQHLADALQHNTVTLILSSSISYTHLHFFTDTHHTKAVQQSNRSCRSTISR